jgi:hypothetical protein
VDVDAAASSRLNSKLMPAVFKSTYDEVGEGEGSSDWEDGTSDGKATKEEIQQGTGRWKGGREAEHRRHTIVEGRPVARKHVVVDAFVEFWDLQGAINGQRRVPSETLQQGWR